MKPITSSKRFFKWLEDHEPKGIIDYIFKGSALSQWHNRSIKDRINENEAVGFVANTKQARKFYKYLNK